MAAPIDLYGDCLCDRCHSDRRMRFGTDAAEKERLRLLALAALVLAEAQKGRET